MGLDYNWGSILRPFLSRAEIGSGVTVHTILDPSHAYSHGHIADCKRRLELDFLP